MHSLRSGNGVVTNYMNKIGIFDSGPFCPNFFVIAAKAIGCPDRSLTREDFVLLRHGLTKANRKTCRDEWWSCKRMYQAQDYCLPIKNTNAWDIGKHLGGALLDTAEDGREQEPIIAFTSQSQARFHQILCMSLMDCTKESFRREYFHVPTSKKEREKDSEYLILRAVYGNLGTRGVSAMYLVSGGQATWLIFAEDCSNFVSPTGYLEEKKSKKSLEPLVVKLGNYM
jgi:hypothetical protein